MTVFKPKISVLLSSRKNSKFLSKFLFNYLEYTNDLASAELLVMYSGQDTWNTELIKHFQSKTYPFMRFYSENYGLGRSGLHQYFNELAARARGDWLIYFCDDHCIVRKGWDTYLYKVIEENKIDPNKVNMIVPKWDNVGAMNQILSRAWFETLRNIGRFGNIDSYNNFVAEKIDQDRVRNLDEAFFHDFTHDPEILTAAHSKLDGENPLPEEWGSVEIQNRIIEDGARLQMAIEGEVS